MYTAIKMKVISITALVVALLGTYLLPFKSTVLPGRDMKDLWYDTRPVLRYQIKGHTRVIDAKVNKQNTFTVNYTLEYIFRYSYKRHVYIQAFREPIHRFDIDHLYTKYKISNITAHTLTSHQIDIYVCTYIEIENFAEAVHQNTGIVDGTTGHSFIVRILSANDSVLLKPSASVEF
ncbi:hypothetical protein GHT06_017818 [Daphnia sinensis]|uniref:Uncharacterized protein n=1 Tax=Daphnia sinensis TaxID=1820382 RepID=A0AAD5LCT4_9CRUS|nr:hypothetical protein GHT06_017818 [Daphnia sinensis]